MNYQQPLFTEHHSNHFDRSLSSIISKHKKQSVAFSRAARRLGAKLVGRLQTAE